MSGVDLAAEVTRRRPGTPCLFMSGYTPGTAAGRQVLPVGLPLLQKPFDVATLAARVNEALRVGVTPSVPPPPPPGAAVRPPSDPR